MAPCTQSGIYFNRGSKKLKLRKEEINEALDFPDDFEFKNSKQEKKFVKTFIDDVTRFSEKIAISTQPISNEATSKIAKFILKSAETVDNQKKTSVFASESTGSVRTALVQCNFTDISRLISDLRLKLYEDEDQEVSDFVVNSDDAIHSIIDRIVEISSGTCVILIRQFESLRPQLLDSLISLIYSTPSLRLRISMIRIVVCVSTSPEFFKQSCSLSSLNLMNLKIFEFTKLDEIFRKVISTGIHSKFQPPRAKPKNIEDDDPTLLTNFDVAPAVFSGKFLKYLQNRFFGCDYSIDALIRAVQLSLLQKYLEDPLWNTETHDLELKKYDRVLETFQREFWPSDDISLHIEVQSDSKFWEKIQDSSNFLERKQFIFDLNQKTIKTSLVDFVKRILKEFCEVDREFCEKLIELMDNLQNTASSMESSGNIEGTPSKIQPDNKKMSFLEMQKQKKAEMAAKMNNPVRVAKNALCSHVMSFFEATLQPYPSTWRNVIGSSEWTSSHVKTSADSNDEEDLERCLLNTESHVGQPIVIAWRCLLTCGKFKSVGINEWASEFLKQMTARKASKKEAKGAFFAAAGQLEHIGLIRGAADRKSTNVNILYHPISFIADI